MKQFLIRLFCHHEWAEVESDDRSQEKWYWTKYECKKCGKITWTL